MNLDTIATPEIIQRWEITGLLVNLNDNEKQRLATILEKAARFMNEHLNEFTLQNRSNWFPIVTRIFREKTYLTYIDFHALLQIMNEYAPYKDAADFGINAEIEAIVTICELYYKSTLGKYYHKPLDF